MDKRKVLDLLIERLQSELDAVAQGARAAHEAATHPEAKPENQYDTRGLEASYLAGAQASRAAELQAQVSAYRLLDAAELDPQDPIAPGALVELELEEPAGGRRSFYFIVPRGGGIAVQLDGRQIQALAPGSPMGESLMGRKRGDRIDVETRDKVREYRIVSVK